MVYDYIKNYKHSIGYILFKKVYLTYFILLIIFMTYQIISQFETVKNVTNKKSYKVEKVYKDLFAKQIFQKNSAELKELSKIVFATTDISGISIVDNNSDFIFLNGNISNKFLNKANKDVVLFDESEFFTHKIVFDNSIEMFFYTKKSDIFNIVWSDILLILINMLLSMIILWILFVIFTGKYLIKPLNTIIDATNRFDVEEHEVIEIDLKDLQENELHKLSSVFNKMSKRINESYINMQQLTMIREIQKNKLEDQKTELIQANKSKDDFLANMSHELKTPLNSINVISDVMMRNKANNLDERQVKNLEIINKCGKDLLFLINDVLDISKLEAGQIILNNTIIDIKELIRSIYDMFYPQTKVKDVDFVLKIDESLNNIYSDEDRIKQIVKNLLSNALKFTPKGKISLIVKDENENVRIIVKDEGIGIPEDKLEHIFDRFKQVDGSTTRKYGGTGLGLAICKELAHLLKGNITVKSELDKGSSFEVVISKNEDLKNSLDLLDLKNDLPKDKSEKILIEKKEEKIVDVKKDVILVLNNDPINFFTTIVELNKKYTVKQCTSLDELKKLYDENKSKILIDIGSLDINQIEHIKESFKDDLILLYENEIDSNIAQYASQVIKKPLDIEKINMFGEN